MPYQPTEDGLRQLIRDLQEDAARRLRDWEDGEDADDEPQD